MPGSYVIDKHEPSCACPSCVKVRAARRPKGPGVDELAEAVAEALADEGIEHRYEIKEMVEDDYYDYYDSITGGERG